MITKLFASKLLNTNVSALSVLGLSVDLNLKIAQPRSTQKSRSKRAKYFESKPHLFKKVAKVKIPDFAKPQLYPVTIPIKYRYVYRPSRTITRLNAYDYLNFKAMTGNEILMNLENAEHLRPDELVGALLQLGLRKGSESIDWNTHEYVQNCVRQIIQKSCTYKTNTISTLIRAVTRLRLNDEVLWTVLERDSSKLVHRMKPKGFAAVFQAFFEDQKRGTKEFKQRLASLAPLHLSKMDPESIVRCFEFTINEGLMNDHLLHNHYHNLFWRRNKWFGAWNYPSIIKGLVKLNYDNDHDEFWKKEFLPKIHEMVDKMNENHCEELINALTFLGDSYKNISVDEYVDVLKKRIIYCKTTLKAIENAKLFNMVLNDIEFYKQKEKVKLGIA